MSEGPVLSFRNRFRLATSVLMVFLGALVLYRVVDRAPSIPGVLLGMALLGFGLYRLSFYWKRQGQGRTR